jgi:tripartite-type tricarboxylate transporter receptor subunit TctC
VESIDDGGHCVRVTDARQKVLTMLCMIRLVLAAFLATVTSAALAQTWPARPIRLMLPFPPGGATDVIARVVGQPLSARLGQPMVVENRPGSNGNIAAETVAHARPDGYTLLLGSDSLFGINPHLYAKMPIDPHKELLPVATLVSNQLVLAINPTVMPVGDLREFVTFTRSAGKTLFYASIGNGSQHHLAMEMLKQYADIKLTHVPYKGGGPAAIALMSGEVGAMFGGGSVVPLIKQGKMRALGVTSTKRSPALPDLPTIGEIYPGYEVNIWQGLVAPLGTPEAIVTRLRSEVNAVLALPEVSERLAATGSGDPYITTLAEFAGLIRRDFEKYGRVIRETGTKVDD